VRTKHIKDYSVLLLMTGLVSISVFAGPAAKEQTAPWPAKESEYFRKYSRAVAITTAKVQNGQPLTAADRELFDSANKELAKETLSVNIGLRRIAARAYDPNLNFKTTFADKPSKIPPGPQADIHRYLEQKMDETLGLKAKPAGPEIKSKPKLAQRSGSQEKLVREKNDIGPVKSGGADHVTFKGGLHHKDDRKAEGVAGADPVNFVGKGKHAEPAKPSSTGGASAVEFGEQDD
jgi:hypothetical protein